MNKKTNPDTVRREFIKVYQDMFDDSHQRTMKEISRLEHSLSKDIGKFDELKVQTSHITNDQLISDRIQRQNIYERKYRKFRMPKLSDLDDPT